jgi:hypothetical protein
VEVLAPVELLNVSATELGDVLGKPDTVHLWIPGHCGSEAVPPDQVKVLFHDDALCVK